jgi:hypothetical protein
MDSVCHQMTGLYTSDIQWLYEECREALLALRISMRQRNENVAPPSPRNMLAITIHWLRKYPSFGDLAVDMQRTNHFLSDLVGHVVHIMDDCIVKKLIRPVDHTSPISTRSSLQLVKIVVDTTFIPLPKTPFDPKRYHKKSPTKSAWKFEVACDLSHRIVSVSDAYNGGAHDMRIIRESGILQQQSETSRIIGDKGYEGKLGIITPMSKRKKRSRELLALEEEKDKRHELESERAAIENINERLKEWKIIGSVYRGGNQHHSFMDAVIRVVCALTNLIMRDHPIRKKK